MRGSMVLDTKREKDGKKVKILFFRTLTMRTCSPTHRIEKVCQSVSRRGDVQWFPGVQPDGSPFGLSGKNQKGRVSADLLLG